MGISTVRGSIPNLLNGVSQQAPASRLVTQGEAQLNGLSSVLKGLGKRPHTEHIARLTTSYNQPTNLKVHFIDQSTSERFIVIIDHQNVRVFTLAGAEVSVSKTPTGWASYFSSTSPYQDISCLTIKDTTLIANATKTPAMTSDKSATFYPTAIVWVKTGLYSTTYQVKIDGQTASYTTPDSTGDSSNWRTTYIAAQLQASIMTLGGGGVYVAYQDGSVLNVLRSDHADFTISVSDSYGDNALSCVKGTTQKYQDLPRKSYTSGWVVCITGDPESLKDNYYLKYSNGSWIETTAEGISYKIDADTMPYKLVKSGSSWSLGRSSWDNREVGDEDTNPTPSIIGQSINDMFFYQDRLGFVSGSTVFMSYTGEHFNLWADTSLDTMDSDPIDVTPAVNKASTLRHAIPMFDRLLLFGDRAQYNVTSNGGVSPKDVRVDIATGYEYSGLAKPVVAGNSVFFTVSRGGYTGIMEYLIDPDTQQTHALDTTEHLPTYVPGNVFKLLASSNAMTVMALTLNSRASMWVYNYWWSGTEKVQSSWSQWTFDCTAIVGAEIIDSYLYLVLYRADDGLYLERMSLVPSAAAPGMATEVLLDRRCIATGVYDINTDRTTWTLPYSVSTDKEIRVIRGSAFDGKGTALSSVTRPTTDTVAAVGDHTKGACYLGLPYTFEYQFSELFMREGERQEKSIITGRLQLTSMTVKCADTHFLKAEVTPHGRDTASYTLSPSVSEALLGSTAPASQTLTFPISSRSNQVTITLKNDTHLPCWIQSAEWLGRYNNRGATK